MATTSTSLAGEDIEVLYGNENERTVQVATGYRKPLRQAPSVATVVTAADIKAIGASTLDQVLQTVPGVHMSTSLNITSLPFIRGIGSDVNANVLVLVDGIPYGQSLTNTFGAFDNFPVNNVERIEVLRGPVSALYGADAVAGVINIVTKTAEHFHGTELGTRIGQFDTYDGWLLEGGTLGPVDVSFGISGRSTQGFDGAIAADAQTVLDRVFGTRASLAPGNVSGGRDVIDARLNVSAGPVTARVGFFDQQNIGMGTGFLSALDNKGHIDIRRINVDLIYDDRITPTLTLNAFFRYLRQENTTDTRLFPPGAFLGVPPGFPDGVRELLLTTEQQWRGEVSALYTGFSDHTLRMGGGYWHGTYEDIDESRNYLLVSDLVVPAGQFASTDALGVATAFPESRRDVYYSYVQDDWAFAPDWTLTTGVRVDHYSDSGTTANPRISLIWQTTHDLTTRLMYGRAFRAPAFIETTTRNSPLARGNPNLKPETIDNLDLVFDKRWTTTLDSTLNLFWYQQHDRISRVGIPGSNVVTWVNQGDVTGYGLELESTWSPIPTLRVKGSYAFQDANIEETNTSPGLVPHHLLYAEADWQFMPLWFFNLNTKVVMDRDRTADDPRSPIDDYTLLNLTIRRERIGKHLDLSFSIRNLLDIDAREPSTFATALPGDLPTAGLNVFGSAIIAF